MPAERISMRKIKEALFVYVTRQGCLTTRSPSASRLDFLPLTLTSNWPRRPAFPGHCLTTSTMPHLSACFSKTRFRLKRRLPSYSLTSQPSIASFNARALLFNYFGKSIEQPTPTALTPTLSSVTSIVTGAAISKSLFARLTAQVKSSSSIMPVRVSLSSGLPLCSPTSIPLTPNWRLTTALRSFQHAPRKPRDKAKAEARVRVVERWILARVRKQTFFSVGDLNLAIFRAARRPQ